MKCFPGVSTPKASAASASADAHAWTTIGCLVYFSTVTAQPNPKMLPRPINN